MEDLVVYEMHVRGFTWDRSSGVTSPGANHLRMALPQGFLFPCTKKRAHVLRTLFAGVLPAHHGKELISAGCTWHVQQSAHPDRCSHCGTGTFSGILEKLDYLSTLGINALELQPIHEFNELEYYGVSQLPAWNRHLLIPVRCDHRKMQDE